MNCHAEEGRATRLDDLPPRSHLGFRDAPLMLTYGCSHPTTVGTEAGRVMLPVLDGVGFQPSSRPSDSLTPPFGVLMPGWLAAKGVFPKATVHPFLGCSDGARGEGRAGDPGEPSSPTAAESFTDRTWASLVDKYSVPRLLT